MEHLLFKCRRAQLIWKLSPVKWDRLAKDVHRFSWWWKMVCSLKRDMVNEDQIQLSVYILWMLWKARNLRIFKGEMQSEKETVDMAMAMTEWQEFGEIRRDQCFHGLNSTNGQTHQGEVRVDTIVGCIIVYINACSMNQRQAGLAAND